MPCCVRNCTSGAGLLKFPESARFRKRWLDAISYGTGEKVSEIDEKQAICLAHFGPRGDMEYQEPTRFQKSNGEWIFLASCRLCFRIAEKKRMFCLSGQLAGCSLDVVIKRTLAINISAKDFLRDICLQCVTKIDLVRAVQNVAQAGDCHFGLLQKSKRPLEALQVTLEEVIEESVPCEVRNDPEPRCTSKVIYRPSLPRRKRDTTENGESVLQLSSRTCYICSGKDKYRDKDELIAHLVQEHAGKVECVCTICDGKTFSWVRAYNHHLSRHDEQLRPLKCNFCPIRFSTENALNTHENKLHGTSHKLYKPAKVHEGRWRCSLCSALFKNIKYVRRHMENKHGKGRSSECKICHRKFDNATSMASHMLVHFQPKREKLFKCVICAETFRSKLELQKHKLIVHKGKKFECKQTYSCHKCQLVFEDSLGYYKHREAVHSGNPFRERYYECLICSAKLKNAGELMDHIVGDHSIDNYPHAQCSVCPSKFLSARQLRAHAGYKHPEAQKEPVVFQCDHCDQKHYTQRQMDKHMAREHGAEKRFGCDICGKRYILRRSLGKHKKTHQKENQHLKCNLCDATFALKSAIYEHWKTAHGTNKWEQKKAVAANSESTNSPLRDHSYLT
ncbi:zinc finger protein 888-like [Sabethes cyaneus]|uniref:zinc finger protein 888-like n=1 Tax=Sabethes cyaneus TaxID=53552 RepID=UPI00237EA606|nr:zinc finger protein 888-like [Sabethes cyaneus]